ncbi:hypothetical protein LTR85_001436 [Meristemomyces frigidus]|nr:hypothetical protein LTR85_001436 [Meristemomyces frigidus]
MTRRLPTIGPAVPVKAEHQKETVDQTNHHASANESPAAVVKVQPMHLHNRRVHIDTTSYLDSSFALDKDVKLRKKVAQKLMERRAEEKKARKLIKEQKAKEPTKLKPAEVEIIKPQDDVPLLFVLLMAGIITYGVIKLSLI